MLHRVRWTLLLALGLAACWSPSEAEEEGTYIRLENAGAHALVDVTFASGHDPLTWPRIEPGERTGWARVERAYRYGYIEVHVAGERLVLQPIDYVGEEPLGPGRFTFRVVARPDPPSLELTLVR